MYDRLRGSWRLRGSKRLGHTRPVEWTARLRQGRHRSEGAHPLENLLKSLPNFAFGAWAGACWVGGAVLLLPPMVVAVSGRCCWCDVPLPLPSKAEGGRIGSRMARAATGRAGALCVKRAVGL